MFRQKSCDRVPYWRKKNSAVLKRQRHFFCAVLFKFEQILTVIIKKLPQKVELLVQNKMQSAALIKTAVVFAPIRYSNQTMYIILEIFYTNNLHSSTLYNQSINKQQILKFPFQHQSIAGPIQKLTTFNQNIQVHWFHITIHSIWIFYLKVWYH